MTRTKETKPGSGEIPQYKSHPSRVVISLRKAYDNLRERAAERSAQINKLREGKRDLEKSRNKWKAETRQKNKELETQSQELEAAKKRIEELESKLKKKQSAPSRNLPPSSWI